MSCRNLLFEIPSQIKSIGYFAFTQTGLKNVVIPKGVDAIDSEAFSECERLRSVKILGTISEIGYGAFAKCNSLQEIEVDSCDYIDTRAFSFCSRLRNVRIGYVNYLGDGAFSDCTSLISLDINSVNSIGFGAFMGCTSLQEILLPEGLQKMYGSVFENCTSLRSIDIPSSLKETGNLLFSGCRNLSYVRWNSKSVAVPMSDGVFQYNTLLYVPEGAKVDPEIPNVIVGGRAKKIVLQQYGSFYCPESFTASEVVFEHDFGNDRWKDVVTGNTSNMAARWNTLVLPFTVTSIESESKGALAPFETDEVICGKARPFWLCEMTASGWKHANAIEAHKPYIYAMPNNPKYLDAYNIQDLVSFKAQNVTIEKTHDEMSSSPVGPNGWALTPTYEFIAAGNNYYTINWFPFRDNYSIVHPVGNCFYCNERDIDAFEAYIQCRTATRLEYIPLNGIVTTRMVHSLGKVPQRDDMRLQ